MARVLIFNPDPPARATLQVLLELEGHECGVADSAEEVGRQMRWQHFDLVVIDTQGVPTSFEFAQGLRAAGNQTPVLFLGEAAVAGVLKAKVKPKAKAKPKSKSARPAGAIASPLARTAHVARVQQVAPGAQIAKPFEISELLTAINHLTVMNSQRLYSSPALGSGLGRLH